MLPKRWLCFYKRLQRDRMNPRGHRHAGRSACVRSLLQYGRRPNQWVWAIDHPIAWCHAYERTRSLLTIWPGSVCPTYRRRLRRRPVSTAPIRRADSPGAPSPHSMRASITLESPSRLGRLRAARGARQRSDRRRLRCGASMDSNYEKVILDDSHADGDALDIAADEPRVFR